MRATLKYADGKRVRTQSSRRYVVVYRNAERDYAAIDYRTDVLDRARAYVSKHGGRYTVFDTHTGETVT